MRVGQLQWTTSPDLLEDGVGIGALVGIEQLEKQPLRIVSHPFSLPAVRAPAPGRILLEQSDRGRERHAGIPNPSLTAVR